MCDLDRFSQSQSQLSIETPQLAVETLQITTVKPILQTQNV